MVSKREKHLYKQIKISLSERTLFEIPKINLFPHSDRMVVLTSFLKMANKKRKKDMSFKANLETALSK